MGLCVCETNVYSAATTSDDGGGFAAANFSNFSGDVAISWWLGRESRRGIIRKLQINRGNDHPSGATGIQ